MRDRKEKFEVNLLTLIPRQSLPYVEGDDGTVFVFLPRFGGSRVGKLLERLTKSKPLKLQLDKVGTFTWKLCDGNHSVKVIGEKMQQAFGDEIEPVYDRLALFFQQMERGRMIRWKK